MKYTSMFQLLSSKDHRSSERETIVSGASEPPKSCGFLSLARELRDMIYSELIPSGNTAISQVSQQVHDEVQDNLYKQGICRLQIYCGMHYFEVMDPPNVSLSKVENFNLKINIECQQRGPPSVDLNKRTLAQARRLDPSFQPFIQGPGTCNVTLVFQSAQTFHMPDSVLVLLQCLDTFKRVTLKIHFNFTFHPFDRRNRVIMAPPHRSMLEQMSAVLRDSLGNPDWKSEPDRGPFPQLRPLINPFPTAPYLEFHPSRAGVSQLEPGSTVLHV